jgi:hypothetical protein
MHADCAALVGSFPAARAKISNSLYVLPEVDGRSAVARRYRAICGDVLQAMGVTESELTGLYVIKFASPEPTAIKFLTNTINRQRWNLGIGRRKRQDLGPTENPLDYARSFHREDS